ncbi:MAG: hypothetical protein ACPLKQ_04450 [Candidatus Bathyarchaeales archaeon]
MLENSLLKKPTKTFTEPEFFHVFFLKNDESYYVEVEEVKEIDFTKII